MTNKIAFEIKHDTSLYTKNDSVFPWMNIALDKFALLALDMSFSDNFNIVNLVAK